MLPDSYLVPDYFVECQDIPNALLSNLTIDLATEDLAGRAQFARFDAANFYGIVWWDEMIGKWTFEISVDDKHITTFATRSLQSLSELTLYIRQRCGTGTNVEYMLKQLFTELGCL
ncbi:MAG: hypothetical protein P4L51_23625 [Puia sp.]|nr:hypothetical protein [Puia sp.]